MLVYTNKTVDQDWLCIYILMQKWKISHFRKWRGKFYDSRNKQKKFGSYYIHLNIDTHTPKKLEVALKRKKK